MIRPLFCAALLASAAPVAAQTALPPEPAVCEALEGHPSVLAAKAREEAARAEARGLRAGTHEFTVSGSYIRRSVDREGRFHEYDATLSRAVRLPGKARLDRAAGEQGIAAAENLTEDARHQTALVLNDLWWDWLGASAEAEVDAQGVANYEATLRAVRRQVSLRDAAQLAADQTEAALGDARTVVAQSAGRADLARTRLAVRFPELPLPDTAPAAPEPQLPAEELNVMREQVISRSHEIAAADAESTRIALLAERARKDRIADPSLGLRLFSERDGAERGAGVVFTMPIGGAGRKAIAERAASEGVAAAAELAAVRLDVQEMADSDVSRVQSAFAAWQRARDALQAQMAALEKLRQGQKLGAIDLADVLQGERLAHAAFRSEALARAEAHRAINRLRIDSHNLWISE